MQSTVQTPVTDLQQSYNRLKSLLRQLFQIEDTSDLDFGIYRIMNQKRQFIETFIEDELLKEVESTFKDFAEFSSNQKKAELEQFRQKVISTIGNVFTPSGEVDERYKEAPIVLEFLKKKEELDSTLITENQVRDVFNLVYEFFSRYYENGDFVSKRRYGGRTHYSIPYNGEEILQYWANYDQYYVKTTLYLKSYTFNSGNWQVIFKVKDISNKNEPQPDSARQGESKYFILAGSNPLRVNDKSRALTIWFEYRTLPQDEAKKYGKNIQSELINKVVKAVEEVDFEIRSALLRKNGDDQCLLEKHLSRYVKRNTSDFFVHKDIGSFLSREFDFYLKNEVIDFDEMSVSEPLRLKLRIARIDSLRRVVAKIITFLSQLEDFQRRLFEKKKFVLRTEFCLTLDKVPESLYGEISTNEGQISEWKRLLALDEVTDQSFFRTKGKKTLDIDFLKSHQSLVIDTKFYSQDFKDRLLSSFDNLDDQVGGLLIKGENLQALNLLGARMGESMKCIYIDPPYNTGNDEFIYKDNYMHSSWLSMMNDRLRAMKGMLQEGGVIFVSIDEHEVSNLRALMNKIFGEDNFIADFIWRARSGQSGTVSVVSYQHEYVLCYYKGTEIKLKTQERIEQRATRSDDKGKYRREQLRQWGQGDRREDRPSMFFAISSPDGTEVYPIKDNGSEGRWRVGPEKAEMLRKSGDLDFEHDGQRWQIYRKIREGRATYTAYGTVLEDLGTTADGTKSLQDLFGERVMQFPKPPSLVKFLFDLSSPGLNGSSLGDFFAGSGTTGQAVLDLNESDGGNRRYTLCEVGDHFDDVLKPRMEKLMFARVWKDGKPASNEGFSHIFKYIYLERYEDTLENIVFITPDKEVQKTLERFGDYNLKYMLDYETRSSPVLLDSNRFTQPFNYSLESERGERLPVDLVETFNFLIGIKVNRIVKFDFKDKACRAVFGENKSGKVVVIWREIEQIPGEKAEDIKNREIAFRDFAQANILKESKFDRIYINGDSLLDAVNIEAEFKTLMNS